MKSILLSLIVLACSMGLNAQLRFPKSERIDISKMNIIYSHSIVDPVLSTEREEYEIMQIGDKYIKYDDYNRFRVDSVMLSVDSTSITFMEHGEIYNRFLPKSEFLIRDVKSNDINFYGKVFIDYYIYTENLPKIDWTLTSESDTVCGFLCHKAMGRFRGRDWTAWYSEDIPINAGPWKFNGLPGVILRLVDSTEEHEFEAITINGLKFPILLTESNNRFETNREEYNKSLTEYKMNPSGSIQGTELAPRNADGTEKQLPKRRLFHNPIEKE